jgi:hypothetical protein
MICGPTSIIPNASILIIDSRTDAANLHDQHAVSDSRTPRNRKSGANLPLPGRHTSLSTHHSAAFLGSVISAQVTDLLPSTDKQHPRHLHVADPRMPRASFKGHYARSNATRFRHG